MNISNVTGGSSLTLNGGLGAFHEYSTGPWMRRRVGVPVFRLALTDVLQVADAFLMVGSQLVETSPTACLACGRRPLFAGHLGAGVDAAAVFVAHGLNSLPAPP